MRMTGGFIGKSNTFNSYQSSGVFTTNQIARQAYDSQWALGYDLTKIFPAAYLSLIRSCNTVFYVTQTDGYAGIKAAINKCSGGPQSTTSNNAIVILPGSYDCGNGTPIIPGPTAAAVNNETPLLYDLGQPIFFICAPGQVTLSWVQNLAATGARDCVTIRFQHAYSKLIGAYVKRNNNGATNNYQVAWLGRYHGGAENSNVTSFMGITGNFTSDFAVGSIYNSVLREVNSNNLWSRTYQTLGVGMSPQIIKNSVIYAGAAGMADFNNATNAVWDYIACNTTKGTGTTPWTNSVESVTFNPDYSYTGNAAGVYSGTYAWDPTLTTVSTSS